MKENIKMDYKMENKMENKMEDKMEDKILIIMNQTMYTYLEAEEKLKFHNYNHINVIKEYIGINITEKKAPQISSINQEIYKQIRKQIDITSYNNKNPLNIEHIQQNLLEEEEKNNKNIKY
jgi:hypothetical protein